MTEPVLRARDVKPGNLSDRQLTWLRAVTSLGGVPAGELGLLQVIALIWPSDSQPRHLLGSCRERLDALVREGILVGSVHVGYQVSAGVAP